MHKYAVFSYVRDQVTNETVPVGVVAWSPELGWRQTRFLTADEEVAGFKLEECLPFVQLVQDKLEHWEEVGRLPYCEEKVHPHQDAWWTHVVKLLTHEIRLSDPKPFDCIDPRQSIESLYLSVTAPGRPVMEQQKRPRRAVKEEAPG